jgi:hypothetical protein
MLGIVLGLSPKRQSSHWNTLASAPVIGTSPAITGSLAVGGVLTVSDGYWAAVPQPTFTYQWKLDGVDIALETTNSYTSVLGDATKTVSCVVTATNASGSASAASNDVIIQTPPVNTVAPVASGTATVGSLLSVTTGTWTGVPTPTFTYQWKRAGAAIVLLATSNTYLVVLADSGTTLSCTVTATNPQAVVDADSNGIAIA